MHPIIKQSFEKYLYEENKRGSGKAGSYLKALDYLSIMLKAAPNGFADIVDIWSVTSVERLFELRAQVLKEQKRGAASPWNLKDIAVSYLRDGYCSAALTQLIEFHTQFRYSSKILEIAESLSEDDTEIADRLNIDPEIADEFVHDPNSKDGRDRLQTIKARMGQTAFRDLILNNYQNRCCITGLDIPEMNRASHIIGWAESSTTRMDPRNGLCLVATNDAAFDRKLISLDEQYRIILSKRIRDWASSESLRAHFLNREGQTIELPKRFRPLQDYLARHRKGGEF